MDLKVRVDQLCSITGLALEAEDNAMVKHLQNKVDNLRQEVETKERRNYVLDEHINQAKLELKSQEKYHLDYMNNIDHELARFREGQKCLASFLDFLNSKDFEANSVRIDIDNHLQVYWKELKPYHNRGKAVVEALDRLRELRDKCGEMRDEVLRRRDSMRKYH